MIGKANREILPSVRCARLQRVQENVDTSVPADPVENQLDGFGIEDQKDAAMPLRRRDRAHSRGAS